MSPTVRNHEIRGRFPVVAGALALVALASCSEFDKFFGSSNNSDDDSFAPRSSVYATQPFARVVVNGSHMVFFADEATSGPVGTNLNAANGDLGLDDAIPVLVDLSSDSVTVLRASAQQVQVLGSNVYLAVFEGQDSWDWNGDGLLASVVLLHYPASGGGSPAAPNLAYVDDLDTTAPVPLLTVGDRMYYSASLGQTVGPNETNLKWVDAASPATPVIVLHNIAAAAGQPARPRIVRADEKLLFLTLSEQFGIELNGDGDGNDTNVLALLDATNPAAVVLSTGLALANFSGNTTPALRARARGTGDWVVAFLVSEAQQGNFATGLNDPAGLGFPGPWTPPTCPGYSDTDTNDDVLHFLEFAAWSANPGANPPRNTGLAGANRVLALNAFVATLTPEGADGGCSTNGDGDASDDVLRWTSIANPLAPFTNFVETVAIRASVGGGTFGVTEVGNRFVCVVDEAADNRNHDADPFVNSLLVAWLDPADGALAHWTYDHSTKAGIQAASTNWLGDVEGHARAAVGYLEVASATSLNPNDTDRSDSVPAFASFNTLTPPNLVFPYSGTALDGTNSGLVIAGSWAFFRVNEQADNHDWTGINGLTESVLMFSSVATPGIGFIAALNQLNVPAVVSDGKVGAAFITQESMAMKDFNGDGDTQDYVVRWFKF